MAVELPEYVALGGNGTYVLSWSESRVSWSSGLGKELYGLLNGRYNNSGQSNTGISSIAFTASGRYALCYEGGGWQFCCESISRKVMSDGGTISCLSLGPHGSYIVIGSECVQWKGLPKRAT